MLVKHFLKIQEEKCELIRCIEGHFGFFGLRYDQSTFQQIWISYISEKLNFFKEYY